MMHCQKTRASTSAAVAAAAAEMSINSCVLRAGAAAVLAQVTSKKVTGLSKPA